MVSMAHTVSKRLNGLDWVEGSLDFNLVLMNKGLKTSAAWPVLSSLKKMNKKNQSNDWVLLHCLLRL